MVQSLSTLLLTLMLLRCSHLQAEADPVIVGVGASFPATAYSTWFNLYSTYNRSVTFEYSASSSTTGQAAISAASNSSLRMLNGQPIWFAGSDTAVSEAFYNETYSNGYTDLQQLPDIAGAVVVTYNFEGILTGQLVFTLDIIAKIYLGDITYWNDSQILQLNSNFASKLPYAPIHVLVRNDSSGTTFTLTTALSKANSAFGSLIGPVTIFPDPASLNLSVTYTRVAPPNSIPGSLAMSYAINSSPLSLGYVEQTYADQYLNAYAMLVNAAGEIVAATTDSITKTVQEFGVSIFPKDTSRFWGSLSNPTSNGTYPLVAYSYLIFYRETMPCSLAFELFRYIYWTQTYSSAASVIEQLGFVIPPPTVQSKILTVLQTVSCVDSPYSDSLFDEIIKDLLCGPGTYRVSNGDSSFTCVECAPGTFNLITNGTCQACPTGAVCPGGNVIQAAQYYWRTPPNSSTDESDPFVINPVFTYCGVGSQCCPNVTSDLVGCDLSDACQVNYNSSSKLCSECICPGGSLKYYQWGGKCVVCDSSLWTGIILGLGYIATLIFVIFVMIIPKWRSNFFGDLIFFYQLSSVLVQPALSRVVLGVLNINVDILASDPYTDVCVLPIDPFDKFMVVYLIPFVLLFNLFVIYVFCLIWNAFRHRISFMNYIHLHLPAWLVDRSLRTNMISGLVEVLMVCYMPLVRPSLEVFSCQSVPGFDGQYMRVVPSVQCYAGPHLGVIALAAVILIVAVIVVPIFAFYSTISRAQKGLLNWNDWKDDFGVFYQQFRPLMYFYYGFDILERILLLVVSIALSADDLTQALGMFMTLWFLLYARIYLRPCRQWLDNVLKVFTFMSLAALALLRALNTTNVPGTSWDNILGFVDFFLYFPLILLPPKLYFIGLFMARMWRTVQLKRSTSGLSGAALANVEARLHQLERQSSAPRVDLQDSLPQRIIHLFQTPFSVSANQFMNEVQSDELVPPSPGLRPLRSPSDQPKPSAAPVDNTVTTTNNSLLTPPVSNADGRRPSVVRAPAALSTKESSTDSLGSGPRRTSISNLISPEASPRIAGRVIPQRVWTASTSSADLNRNPMLGHSRQSSHHLHSPHASPTTRPVYDTVEMEDLQLPQVAVPEALERDGNTSVGRSPQPSQVSPMTALAAMGSSVLLIPGMGSMHQLDGGSNA